MTTFLALLAAPTAYAGAIGLHLSLARARHNQVSEGPPPPPGALLAEVRRKWLVRSWALGPVEVAPAAEADPVLCVHGFVGRPSHFRGLQRFLHHRGIPTQTVDLGWKFQGVPSYGPPLIEALEGVERCRVVAHSMGGIVLRHVLAERPDLAAKVTHAVTLGSPHRGTAAAEVPGYEGPFPRGVPADIEHLAPDSPFLQQLPELHEVLPHAVRVAVAASWDVTVFPVERALPEGMDHVLLDGFGHMGLLTEVAAHRAVQEALLRG
jgi:pimeloyl-ACP methyl ester carboxylesterase